MFPSGEHSREHEAGMFRTALRSCLNFRVRSFWGVFFCRKVRSDWRNFRRRKANPTNQEGAYTSGGFLGRITSDTAWLFVHKQLAAGTRLRRPIRWRPQLRQIIYTRTERKRERDKVQ